MTEKTIAPIDSWPLLEIVQACQEQTERWRRGLESDGNFCLEIFRRALALGDDRARDALVETYTPFIKANIARRAAALLARVGDDLVQDAWLAFWSAARGGLSFPSLPQALQYLQLTTASVVIRALREQRAHAVEAPVDDALPLPDPESDPFDSSVKQAFLDRVQALLDPQEYLIFWLRAQQGMPPREIALLLEREGPARGWQVRSVNELYRVIELIFRKLRADATIRELLGEG